MGTRMELQQFQFVLPFKGFKATFPGLLEFLWKAVMSPENVKEFGRKLLEPKTLGALLRVMAIEKLVLELIEKLVCRQPEGDG